MLIHAAVMTVVLLTGGVRERTTVEPADFQSWFESATRGKLRLPREVREKARGVRYVFVGGFWNEWVPGYFSQNARELRNQGVPASAIHYIFPSSSNTVVENLASVKAEFRRIAKLGPERLVVIAHSRGACDALYWALKNPNFTRAHVEAMFLLQGAFGGSRLVDYAMGQDYINTNVTSSDDRGWLAWFADKWIETLDVKSLHPGLSEMSRKDSREFWRKVLAKHAKAIPVVSPKVFFVESSAPSHRLPYYLRLASRIMGEDGVADDGVIAVGDQSLAGLGHNLGVLDAGHSDLTGQSPFALSGRRYRKAVIRSILMALGRLDPPVSGRQPGPV